MWTNREKVLAGALIATILIAVAAFLVATWRIGNVGKIRAIGVEVFEDPGATVPLTLIDWGVLSPGDLAGVTVYVKNTKNVNFTIAMNSSSWEPPEVEQHITVEWNYTGEVLVPEQISPVQITLYVSYDIINVDTFSFDIWIIATEH